MSFQKGFYFPPTLLSFSVFRLQHHPAVARSLTLVKWKRCSVEFLADSWFTGAGKACSGRKGLEWEAMRQGESRRGGRRQEPEADLSSFFQHIRWIQLCRDTTMEPQGANLSLLCHEDTQKHIFIKTTWNTHSYSTETCWCFIIWQIFKL